MISTNIKAMIIDKDINIMKFTELLEEKFTIRMKKLFGTNIKINKFNKITVVSVTIYI